MKLLLTAASVLLIAASSMAQAPQKMNYQAVVRDNADQLIVNTQVGMQISVLQGSLNGTAVFVETHTPTTNTNGLVSLEIGTGTVVTGDFATIDWSNGPYFIKTETDPTGGTNYTISGTNELLSVPFALFAASGTEGPPGPIGPQGLLGPAGPAGADGNGIVSTVDNGNGTFTITYTDSTTFTTSDLTGPEGPAGSVNLYAGDNIIISNDTIHAAVSTSLADADNDTKILVEKTPDDDEIRFDVAGGEAVRFQKNADGQVMIEIPGNPTNTFLGTNSGLNTLSSTNANTFLGISTGNNNQTGIRNTSVGASAGAANVSGSNNTYLGSSSGSQNTGESNVMLGESAGSFNFSGNQNTLVGTNAGNASFSGSGNIFLGYEAGKNEDGNNRLYIENSDADSANALIYGEFDNDLLTINGTLRVNNGTQANGYVLTSDADGHATWTPATSLVVTTAFDTLNGVVLPGSAVNVDSDDFVFGSPQLDNDFNGAHDARIFFDKSKSAFRAGIAAGNQWNESNVGPHSVAMGSSTVASGHSSTSMGAGSIASGVGTTAMGLIVEASGFGATAMGEFSVASGTNSTALGHGTNATGDRSTAMGFNTNATGESSTAMGRASSANGARSAAIGSQVTAGAGYSMALGRLVNTQGQSSVGMGWGTKTFSAAEIALGSFNTEYVANDNANWNAHDRAFVVGNGVNNSNRSDAMVILKNGNTGFGTSIPDTTFHLVGKMKYDDGTQANGHVLTSDADGHATWTPATSLTVTTVFKRLNGVVLPGSPVNMASDDFVFGSPQLNYDGDINHGSRFFFDKNKSAFRAGSASGPQWNESNIGQNSVAMGSSTVASGSYSTSMGASSNASGFGSTAIGLSAAASGFVATAMGEDVLASGTNSSAMGYGTNATGDRSTAMGFNTNATGESSTAMGRASSANGARSAAIGSQVTAGADYSIALGRVVNTQGQSSVGMGWGIKTFSAAEIALGSFNTEYVANDNANWNANDRAFVVGNGADNANRSDAMVILKNGNTGFGTSIPDTTFHLVGKMKYDDGMQANGRVLTSDANGNASWQQPQTFTTDTLSIISDADNDTKIMVEQSADEDVIHFELGGTEYLRLDAGRMEVLNTGNSIFLGEGAGRNDDFSGNINVGIGMEALTDNTTGHWNTAIGHKSLFSNTTGGRNTALGSYALLNCTDGSSNTVVGIRAFYDNNGSNNVALGADAGQNNTSGSGNIFLGFNAGLNELGSNKLYVANTSTSTPLIYGEFDNDLVRVNGNLEAKSSIFLNEGNQDLILRTNEASNYVQLDVGGPGGHHDDDIIIGDATTAANTVVMNGGVKVGTSGTPVSQMSVHTQAYNIPSMNENQNLYIPFNVTGAEVGDLVFVTSDAEITNGVAIAHCYVSDTNEVTVKFRNDGGSFGDGSIPEINYKFLLIKGAF